MREYTSGQWGFSLVWGIEASVFPRAFVMALPNAIVCFIFATLANGDEEPVKLDSDRAKNATSLISAFTSVLFFVLYFRSNVAYSRWWEGGTLLQQTRGEWFNAYSSLIAFSAPSPEMGDKVEEFHHLLARLMSMLFCAGLQQVSPDKDRAFEIISTTGIESESLAFLSESPDKVEVLLQWIQRSTVLNMYNGVLPIPPPVMSRAFQEISRGIVNLQNARKIADFPFPFPYAQTSIVMLLLHWVTCPLIASLMLQRYLATLACFVAVFFLWCINFIALQLESPFGDRENDLPMQLFQRDWNKSVGTLLAKRAQHPPKFYFDPEYHRKMHLVMSDGSHTTRRRLTSHLTDRDELDRESMDNHRVESKATNTSQERVESKATNMSCQSTNAKDSKSSDAKVAAAAEKVAVVSEAAAASSEEKAAPPAVEAAQTPAPVDAKGPSPACPQVGSTTVGSPAKTEVLPDVVEDALGSQLESIASPETPPCGSVIRGLGEVTQSCKCDTTDPVVKKLQVDLNREIDIERVAEVDVALKQSVGTVQDLPADDRRHPVHGHAESTDTSQRLQAVSLAHAHAKEDCRSSSKTIDTGQPSQHSQQGQQQQTPAASSPSAPGPTADNLPAQTIGTRQSSAEMALGNGHLRDSLRAAEVSTQPGPVAITTVEDLEAVEAVDMNQAVVQASGTGNAPAKAIDEAAQPTGTGQCPSGPQRINVALLSDEAVNLNQPPASIIGNGGAITKGGKKMVDAHVAYAHVNKVVDTIDSPTEESFHGGRTPSQIGRSQSPDRNRARTPPAARPDTALAMGPLLAPSAGDQENLGQAAGPVERKAVGLSQTDTAADATDISLSIDDALPAAAASGNSACLTALGGATSHAAGGVFTQVIPLQACLPPPAVDGRSPDAGASRLVPHPRAGDAPAALAPTAVAGHGPAAEKQM